MKLINKILVKLDKRIANENKQRFDSGGMTLKKAKICILGQFSLMTHPNVSAQLTLLATADVDAFIDSDWWIKNEFKKLLNKEGLEYDELSNEIWIPPQSTFTKIYDSKNIYCDVIDPLYALVSKAIKAKEKNKILISDALNLYGDELGTLIQKFGGDRIYFKK